MSNQQPQASTVAFDRERAATYDEKFARMSPMRDAMQFLARVLLSVLPSEARILCVGAGTGSEILELAEAYPGWQFTAVEPASAMLDICRQRAEAAGVSTRCIFHEGYLDSLPATEPFDAATCLLVSHFIMQQEERRAFFAEIASRLRSGGYLVNADLTASEDPATQETLLQLWQRAFRYAGLTEEEIKNNIAGFGKVVGLLTPQEMESTLESAGFEQSTLFLQTLLIHGWYSRRR